MFLDCFGQWKVLVRCFRAVIQIRFIRILARLNTACIFMRFQLVWNLFYWRIQLQEARTYNQQMWKGKRIKLQQMMLNSNCHTQDHLSKMQKKLSPNFLNSINKFTFHWFLEMYHFAKCKAKSRANFSAKWQSNIS